MIFTQKEVDAEAFAKSLNPDVIVSSGINWNWITGFKSREEADKFDNYCNKQGLETRGVYSNSNSSPLTYDVRFRY